MEMDAKAMDNLADAMNRLAAAIEHMVQLQSGALVGHVYTSATGPGYTPVNTTVGAGPPMTVGAYKYDGISWGKIA